MRQRREYCGEGFAGGLCGIDVLLLEVDADTERLQFSHGLQTFFGVACEARGGFDKNTVNAAAAAIFHHPQEVIPLFDGCAGDILTATLPREVHSSIIFTRETSSVTIDFFLSAAVSGSICPSSHKNLSP